MIRYILILMALVCLNVRIQAEEPVPLVAYQLDDYWHFLDKSGKEMFPALRLDDVVGYSEGYFLGKAEINDKPHWVYINLKGQAPIGVDSHLAGMFENGRARIFVYADSSETYGKYGFIDTSGAFVIPLEFDDATEFSDGLAYVFNKYNDFRGYINPDGEVIIRMSNAVGYNFSEGLAAISNKDFKVGYINRAGEMVIDMKYDEPGMFSEGYVKANNSGRFGYINRVGEMVIPQIYDDVRPFTEGLAFVGEIDKRYMSKWGMIDTSGKKIIDFIFDDTRDFSEGLAAVKLDGRWLYIDKTGKNYYEKDYDYADSFVNGLAWISSDKENIRGYINKKGELLIRLPECQKFIDLRLNREVR
ncbi:MAG: WG repeat-containing protein [Bacteroidota bacterium]